MKIVGNRIGSGERSGLKAATCREERDAYCVAQRRKRNK